ncbi:hypothetical protein BAY61_16620 [Prauserella marina]|uniref:PGAP1-like protein n=1 Tax=Prauserella marina TaxID=530584 RepID=A0A222VRK9_9PSEU|nr:alpha/beta fold hydrolase [Prauserella marina]ASR36361.1 hypothetical protein BAY61_16620 [Prauserella marina]PWV77154.1 PGAP1-like protein [Prauserella marina]SDD05674.1 PGAP1-like protein [Prauserella marina]
MKPRAAGGVLAALMLAALVLAPGTGTPARADTSDCVTRSLKPIAERQPVEGTVPVIFVHGINSDATTWDAPEDNTFPRQMARQDGITAWTFDYGFANPEWVTDPRIGPALGTAIDCLAEVSGHKVVLIGHSMGGLVSQVAVTEPAAGGGQVWQRVAEVITIATPYRGSLTLSAAQLGTHLVTNPKARVVMEALLATCTGITKVSDSNPCNIASVLRGPQGTALMYDSPEIAELPPWPPELPVRVFAGDIGLRVGVWFTDSEPVPVGDLAVTLDSAVAHHTIGEPRVLDCEATLLQKLDVGLFETPIPSKSLLTSPCNHLNIKTHQPLITEITERVGEIRTEQQSHEGRLAYATANDVRVWEARSGTSHAVAELPDGHTASGLAWSGSGSAIAWTTRSEKTGLAERIYRADVGTATRGKSVQSWPCESCGSVAFQGELLISAPEDGAAPLLRGYPADGSPPRDIPVRGLPPQDPELCEFTWCGVRLIGGTGSADGIMLAHASTGGGNFGGADRLVRVGEDGTVLAQYDAVGTFVPDDLVFSPDGGTVAYTAFEHLSACEESTSVVLLDLETGAVSTPDLPGPSEGTWVVSAWFDATGTAFAAFAATPTCAGEPAWEGTRIFRLGEDGDWGAADGGLAEATGEPLAIAQHAEASAVLSGARPEPFRVAGPGTLTVSHNGKQATVAEGVTHFGWSPAPAGR